MNKNGLFNRNYTKKSQNSQNVPKMEEAKSIEK